MGELVKWHKESEERGDLAEKERDKVRSEMEKMELEHKKSLSLLKSNLQEVGSSSLELMGMNGCHGGWGGV